MSPMSAPPPGYAEWKQTGAAVARQREPSTDLRRRRLGSVELEQAADD
jgi:hypothetical protein